MDADNGKPWRAFPARQMTGSAYKAYGYIGRSKRERHCCKRGWHSRRKGPPYVNAGAMAERCAEKAAAKLNRQTKAVSK